MSASMVRAIDGYCTFTQTRAPSCSRARCTCPSDAAAIGWVSIVANTDSGSSPSSSRSTSRTTDQCIGGAWKCSALRIDANSAGTMSG